MSQKHKDYISLKIHRGLKMKGKMLRAKRVLYFGKPKTFEKKIGCLMSPKHSSLLIFHCEDQEAVFCVKSPNPTGIACEPLTTIALN